MTTPSSTITPNQRAWREDPDFIHVPAALKRAAQKAKLLAEQTGTPYVVSQPSESVSAAIQPLAGMTAQTPDQLA